MIKLPLEDITLTLEVDKVLNECICGYKIIDFRIDLFKLPNSDAYKVDASELIVKPVLNIKEYEIEIGPYIDREESRLNFNTKYVVVEKEEVEKLELDFVKAMKEIASLRESIESTELKYQRILNSTIPISAKLVNYFRSKWQS